MTVAITGSGGFLGWHTRCAAHALGLQSRPVMVGDAFDPVAAAAAVSGTSRLVHLAGVNRASDQEILDGNLLFARQTADAVVRAADPPPVVVFANSIQVGNGTVYGEAKARAADILRSAAEHAGVTFIDERLPNLFGEHGRPYYNSVVATFTHQIVAGEARRIDVDQELTLLHAQNAADLLLGVVTQEEAETLQARDTVSGVLSRLEAMADTYALGGQVPDLSSPFDRDLFNTYRAAAFMATTPIPLDPHADARGSFFEVVRAHGGGQTSFSTTAPAIMRGQHYHRRKVERFTVVAGEAIIALRQLFTKEVHKFRVASDSPVSIDMPTLWAHNITNVGDSPLYTCFWSNELFDPQHPDTISEPV